MAYDTMLTIPAENSELHVKDNNGDWQLVPHIGGISTGGGDATVTKYTSFGTSAAEAGHPQPPDITCEITSYLPYLPVWKLIRNTREGERDYRFLDGKPITRMPSAGIQAAIAADGAVTFSAPATGTDRHEEVERGFLTGNYAVGLVLVPATGTNRYVIIDVDKTGKVIAVDASTDKFPASPVAEAPMSIVKPAEMTEVTCNLVNVTFSMVQGRIKEGTLSLSPTTLLPAPTLLVDETQYKLGA